MKQISACLVMLLLGLVFALQAWLQKRQPNPELKKQDFFVGTWKLEGTTKQSTFGPGGQKFESREDLEWMPGGFFLLVHSYSGGKLDNITVIGYDSREKVFTHTSFTSSGQTELWKGTADNDSWTWTRDATVDGKPVVERLAIKKTSPDSYAFVVEMKPGDSATWSIVAEGTGAKTK